MKWSWRIGEFAGIGVYVHATFLLLLIWVGLAHWLADRALSSAVTGVAFILVLFGCVVLHEYGHALTARRFGIATRDITLLPIGGLARLEKMPDDPRQEFWVALAGPAVNIVIAGVLMLWSLVTDSWVPVGETTLSEGSFGQRLIIVNLMLCLFNLVPAFPMDGGRVLRAALAMRMDYTRATNIAAALGQAIAFVFGFLGLFYNPFLIFIALFVWMGAGQEASLTGIKAALGGIPVRRGMVKDFHVLNPQDSLARAIDEILAGFQHDFPVVEDSTVVGILTRKALMVALAERGTEATVASIMNPDFQVVDANEMMDRAFQRLQNCDCHTMPVLHQGKLVGLFTMDNMGEFLGIQAALDQRKRGLRNSLLEA